MAPRRSDAARQVEPGVIYDLPGTHDGEQARIAYDNNFECHVAYGEKGYGELEAWLRSRGVKLAAGRPALWLIRCFVLCAPMSGW